MARPDEAHAAAAWALGAERPSVLLYDWDNTLVDAWAGVAAALNAAFADFGMPHWSEDEVKHRVRVAMSHSFPALFGENWRRARDIFHRAMLAGHLDHLRPMPGAVAALEAGRGWTQGVVSNKGGDYLRAEVAHLGWSGHFGTVVGAGDAAADKPDAAPILLALAQLNARPGRHVWYMGDTALDMQAARAAGVTAVLVGDAVHDGGAARAEPDLHLPSADALAAALRGFASANA